MSNYVFCSKMLEFFKKFRIYFFLLLLFSLNAHASFIESTIGTAVVNDATAAFYNPAALVLLKNSQFISLGSISSFHTRFTGKSTLVPFAVTESGSADSNSHYYLPSFYFASPTTDRITLGVTVTANSANREIDQVSILRYSQASNTIEDYDLVPAIGIKINEKFSIGAGINFSYLNLHLKPITAFPGSTSMDSESDNQSDGTGIGANVGFLIKANPTTVIGFNYRSATSYQLSGKSVFNGKEQVISNNYHFNIWTPARAVLSISHFVTPKMGFITTLQHIQWSIFKNIRVFGIASQFTPAIINADIPYFLQDTWYLTLGTHYRINSEWIVRVAGSYNPSPGNPRHQITTGDGFLLGASMGYVINKTLTLDGSFAHAFIQDENIDLNSSRRIINGTNEASRNAVSLKLTFNIS